MKPKTRSARVAVLRHDCSEIIIVRNSKYGVWELPGGTQEPPEHIKTTAIRELQEEASITAYRGHLEYVGDTKYWGRKRDFHEAVVFMTQRLNVKGPTPFDDRNGTWFSDDPSISHIRWLRFLDTHTIEDWHPFSKFALEMVLSKLALRHIR